MALARGGGALYIPFDSSNFRASQSGTTGALRSLRSV
jgi:hypothetical protein